MKVCIFNINNPSMFYDITYDEFLLPDLSNYKIMFLLGIKDDNLNLVNTLLTHKVIDFQNFKTGSVTSQSYNKLLSTWRQTYIKNKLLWRTMTEIAFSREVDSYIKENSSIISCLYNPETETCQNCVENFLQANNKVKG